MTEPSHNLLFCPSLTPIYPSFPMARPLHTVQRCDGPCGCCLHWSRAYPWKPTANGVVWIEQLAIIFDERRSSPLDQISIRSKAHPRISGGNVFSWNWA
ncbi:hypothetical protein J2X72_004321 [Phyllobacterium sp. 1468]|nr:hypothetical protein [Phyllobacterium sp. 1468]